MASEFFGPDSQYFEKFVFNDIRVSNIAVSTLAFIYAIACIFFFPTAILNQRFRYEYPRIDSALPGALANDRYTVSWFLYAAPALRIIVPILCSYTTTGLSQWKRSMAKTLIILLIFMEVGIFLFNFFFLCFCNGSLYSMIIPFGVFGVNPCNADAYCCDNFATDLDTCVNTIACSPNILDSQLSPNPTFLIQWLCSLGFLLLNIVLYALLQAGDKLIGRMLLVRSY